VRYLNSWLRFMLTLSYTSRLTIAVFSGLLCLVLYISTYPASYSGTFLTIPVALIAWLFKRRGMFIFCCILFVFLLIFYLLTDINIFQSAQFVSFVEIGSFVLLIEGLLVGSLRELVDLSEETRQQVASLYEQQRELSQMKDQFILNVNHELRTPLTAVYGYLELLLEYNEQLEPSMRATFLKNAMYSSEELQLLVNNVLDTIQIGNEKEHLYVEELPVADVVYEVIEHFDPRRKQEYAIQMDIPPHLVVRANPQYFRQVLRNLLSNATKYAAHDTPIIVSAALYGALVKRDHPSPEICISVKDSGPGIPPENISSLFGQFVRLQRDISGKVRGTGLGLYVSKQLVEVMEGKIWVESTGVAGEGSTFRFTLPCVPHPRVVAHVTANHPTREPSVVPATNEMRVSGE
jgi:signal transduction histidine kinase